MADLETDDHSSSDNGGEPEKHPEASYSSTDSDDILDMVVEAARFRECSGSGEHANCWPSECIKTQPPSQAAPREAILKQGAADYDEDLRHALKLSVKEEHQTQELKNAETKILEEAKQLSLLEAAGAKPKASAMNSDEKKQLEMAIMASLEDVSSPTPGDGVDIGGAQNNTLAWKQDERNTLENQCLSMRQPPLQTSDPS